MSSSAAALAKPLNFQVHVTSGPRNGEVFPFQQPLVTVGRDPTNDLVFLNDPKMSRHHAEFYVEAEQLWVRNVSLKNFVLVNGVEVEAHPVNPRDQIVIGETYFSAQSEKPPGLQPTMALPIKPALKIPKYEEIPHYNRPHQSGPNPIFFVVVGIVAILLIWLLSSGGPLSRKENRLRTQDQVLMDLEKSDTAIKALEKKQVDSGQQSLQYKTAQEHYLKGFRDYRQSQYGRAISSFQVALSFYPQHELARKYLTLSKRKFDEVVQFNMIQGRRYRGKNNFRLCKSSYANVMIMLKDPNDPVYKEARQYYNECSLLNEGRY